MGSHHGEAAHHVEAAGVAEDTLAAWETHLIVRRDRSKCVVVTASVMGRRLLQAVRLIAADVQKQNGSKM